MTDQPTAEQVIWQSVGPNLDRPQVVHSIVRALIDAGFRIAPPGSIVVYGSELEGAYNGVLAGMQGETGMLLLTQRVES